jgi:hypothetical protein
MSTRQSEVARLHIGTALAIARLRNCLVFSVHET